MPLQGDFSAKEMIWNVADVDPKRREELVELLDIDLRWRMHRVSDGQRRRVQICMGLLRPFQVRCDTWMDSWGEGHGGDGQVAKWHGDSSRLVRCGAFVEMDREVYGGCRPVWGCPGALSGSDGSM